MLSFYWLSIFYKKALTDYSLLKVQNHFPLVKSRLPRLILEIFKKDLLKENAMKKQHAPLQINKNSMNLVKSLLVVPTFSDFVGDCEESFKQQFKGSNFLFNSPQIFFDFIVSNKLIKFNFFYLVKNLNKIWHVLNLITVVYLEK